MAMSKWERLMKIHRLTVGVSSTKMATKNQTTPFNTSVNLEHGSSWREYASSPYLVPQEAYRTTTVTAQAAQTKEHDRKQDDIGGKCDNEAESDAVQVEHTSATVYVP
jgi:hypothetical protein